MRIMKSINIYTLLLRGNKYYIGKTRNVNFRINEHFNGIGSAWTKKYEPIKVLKIFKNCSIFDEDKYTKIYMAKYGIDNVRGGNYVQLTLDKNTRVFLENELNSAQDRCFKCGKLGHFIKECKAGMPKTVPKNDLNIKALERNLKNTIPNWNGLHVEHQNNHNNMDFIISKIKKDISKIKKDNITAMSLYKNNHNNMDFIISKIKKDNITAMSLYKNNLHDNIYLSIFVCLLLIIIYFHLV